MSCGLEFAGGTWCSSSKTTSDTLVASWTVLFLRIAEAGGYIIAELAVRTCFTDIARCLTLR